MGTNNKESRTSTPPAVRGILIAIGGHEDKSNDMQILRRVAHLLRGRPLAIATIASEQAGEMWADYKKAFKHIGVSDVVHLELSERTDAQDDERVRILDRCGGVFFTGGDQLRITSKLGGTAVCDRMHALYGSGGVIAGTSAGASVLTETMMVAGSGEKTHRISDSLMLSPGLGFLPGVVIDQHFAERGRIARLLGVVAHSPRTLGIGIDENTAIEISHGTEFRVNGAGAVYVLDGRPVTHTNISEEETEKTMSMFDVRLHVLSQGDCFDMVDRRPYGGSAASVENGKGKAGETESAGKNRE
jgi:cyanophycinase